MAYHCFFHSHMFPTLKVWPGELPDGPVVKNPSCSAGDTGLIPSQGTKIPHAMERLSPSTAARESVHHNEKIPHDSTKSLHATTKTGGSQINKYIFLKVGHWTRILLWKLKKFS